MEYLLRTRHLTKSYKGKEVVSDVSMNVRRGEIYGFLGQNGAGKTTVMRMITGLVKATGGSVELFGQPLGGGSVEPFKRMGSVIEFPVFYGHLGGRDNLELHCEYMGFYDGKAIDEALELVGLSDIGAKPVRHFSLGMKQRLGIARAICARPELLVLDEPVNGLDPVGIRELRELFLALSRRRGMTLLISSHLLQEIEQVADTIGVIHRGRLIEEVSMDEVRSRSSEYIELTTTDGKHAAVVLEEKLGVANYRMTGSDTIRIYEPGVSPVHLSRELVQSGVGIESMSKRTVSLESYFLQLIQGGGEADA